MAANHPTMQNRIRKDDVKARFKDEQYINWQKACQILLIGKKDIDNLVEKRIGELHDEFRNFTDKASCKNCTSDKIQLDQFGKWTIDCKVCRKGVEIICQKALNVRNLNWKNADIQKWPSNQWEVAKVFMGKLPRDESLVPTTDKGKNKRRASKNNDAPESNNSDHEKDGGIQDVPYVPPESIDISHMLNVFVNCTHFHKVSGEAKAKVKEPLNKKALESIKGVINMRNKLFHNAVMKIRKPVVEEYGKIMEDMMKKLRLHNPDFLKRLNQLKELDPVYMDRKEYDDFLRLEALVVSNLLDAQDDDEQAGATEDDEDRQRNLDLVLQMLEGKGNEDLRASVSMIRKIPARIGSGDGDGEQPDNSVAIQEETIIPNEEAYIYWQAMCRIALDLEGTMKLRQGGPFTFIFGYRESLRQLTELKTALYDNYLLKVRKEDFDSIYSSRITCILGLFLRSFQYGEWLRHKYIVENKIIDDSKLRQVNIQRGYLQLQFNKPLLKQPYITQAALLKDFLCHLNDILKAQDIPKNQQNLYSQKEEISWILRMLQRNEVLHNEVDLLLSTSSYRFDCRNETVEEVNTSVMSSVESSWARFYNG